MFISKFWMLLVSLAIGIVLAVILLARDVVDRERMDHATEILYKELTKIDVALKLHARERLDVLLAIAVDPEIRRSLAEISSRRTKIEAIREKLLTALRNHNNSFGKYKADMLIAIDKNGLVVSQVGKYERNHSYNISGFPVVDGALRGYLRDDILKLDKDVLLFAARPVIEQGRYVGALVHAMKLTDKLAAEISPAIQLAFFAGNVMVAVGASQKKGVKRAQGSYIAKPLDDVISSKSFLENGYSEAKLIDTQDGQFISVYSTIRGEAAGNGVGYALVMPTSTMTSAAEFYEKAGTQDVEALPWGWLVLIVVLTALLGWVWIYIEGERPVSSLMRDIKSLKKSDPKDQLNVYRYRRRIRKVATAVNAVIDYKIRALMEADDSKKKSIDNILGSRSSRLSSATFKFVEPAAEEIPPPPPAGTGPVKPLQRPSQQQESQSNIPISQTSQGHSQPRISVAQSMQQSDNSEPNPMEPEVEKRYFKEIFDEFVALKKKLNESIEQLTYDRFEGTLKKNRDTLIARYKCSRVKFQVYEKDGKASLKATPVKS